MSNYVQPEVKPASDEIRNFYIAPPLTALHRRGEPKPVLHLKIQTIARVRAP